MYKLLSERIKNMNGEPEVYIYDEFSEAFRNQVFYIMADVLDEYENYGDSIWNYIHDTFSREKRLKKLGSPMEKCRKDSMEVYVNMSTSWTIVKRVDTFLGEKYLRTVA